LNTKPLTMRSSLNTETMPTVIAFNVWASVLCISN
jgi:hypothetical protein